MLLAICGDEKTHYIQPTDENELEMINFKVPIGLFILFNM